MTAPVPVGTPTTSASAALGTSHSITLPSGITSGEYVLVAATFHSDSNTGPFSVVDPGGFWVLGLSADAGPSGQSAREVFRIWFLLCDGSESGSTLTITTNIAAVSAMVATRVNPNTTGSISTAGVLGSVGVDPPDVSWPSGSYDTLAWAPFWLVDVAPTFSALSPPAGYSLIGDVVSATVGFGGGGHNGAARIGLAYATVPNVSHVDPGVWSGYDASIILIAGPGTYLWRNDIPPTLNEAYWGILAKPM